MGLPLACMFGKHGAVVTVCDINPSLVRSIQSGECPYDEPGLPELMADLHRTGRLSASTDTAKASAEADVIVVIVPAHLTSDREIDFSVLRAASAEIGKGLRRGALIARNHSIRGRNSAESDSYPGDVTAA